MVGGSPHPQAGRSHRPADERTPSVLPHPLQRLLRPRRRYHLHLRSTRTFVRVVGCVSPHTRKCLHTRVYLRSAATFERAPPQKIGRQRWMCSLQERSVHPPRTRPHTSHGLSAYQSCSNYYSVSLHLRFTLQSATRYLCINHTTPCVLRNDARLNIKALYSASQSSHREPMPPTRTLHSFRASSSSIVVLAASESFQNCIAAPSTWCGIAALPRAGHDGGWVGLVAGRHSR